MKGIILAAGKGTRLYPITKPICKPLLPLYDKPMIYYPLAVLMQAGIKDILIIVPPEEQQPFEKLLGNGDSFGVSITYKQQLVQRGIADAFIIGEDFIGQDDVCLALGDNIFYGANFNQQLEQAAKNKNGATIFGLYVEDPRPFGVVEFDSEQRAISIEEKPAEPKSNYIVPGLYFYNNQVVSIAKQVQPSARGELEITSVNNEYLAMGQVLVMPLEQDVAWFDAGNCDSLLQAATAIKNQQKKTGEQIACLEEIAYKQGWISAERFFEIGKELSMTEYGKYILSKKGE